MREEHVDGGFLVTMGIYKGREDFNKTIVRQLQVSHPSGSLPIFSFFPSPILF